LINAAIALEVTELKLAIPPQVCFLLYLLWLSQLFLFMLLGALLVMLAGENYKKLCTCDGTTIWEAKLDFVTSKV